MFLEGFTYLRTSPKNFDPPNRRLLCCRLFDSKKKILNLQNLRLHFFKIFENLFFFSMFVTVIVVFCHRELSFKPCEIQTSHFLKDIWGLPIDVLGVKCCREKIEVVWKNSILARFFENSKCSIFLHFFSYNILFVGEVVTQTR